MTSVRDDFPVPDKPLTEMTRDELRQWNRDLRRWQRDRAVAKGAPPRTMREIEIWRTAADRNLTGRRRVRGVRPVDDCNDEPDGDDAA